MVSSLDSVWSELVCHSLSFLVAVIVALLSLSFMVAFVLVNVAVQSASQSWPTESEVLSNSGMILVSVAWGG